MLWLKPLLSGLVFEEERDQNEETEQFWNWMKQIRSKKKRTFFKTCKLKKKKVKIKKTLCSKSIKTLFVWSVIQKLVTKSGLVKPNWGSKEVVWEAVLVWKLIFWFSISTAQKEKKKHYMLLLQDPKRVRKRGQNHKGEETKVECQNEKKRLRF